MAFTAKKIEYDVSADIADDQSRWTNLDLMMAPFLVPGCCPGQSCEDDSDGGFFVTNVCLG